MLPAESDPHDPRAKHPKMPETIHLALCTCPDQDTAEALAESLVVNRLAACVNIVPGLVSVYHWEGQIERAEEVLLLIKTTEARIPELVAWVEREHPYDVPELIAHPITGGHPGYLEWVRKCTTT
jgi:periplasmic divalent cation tolerance protein